MSKPFIDPRVLPPRQLAAFEERAAERPNALGRYWRITSPAGAVSNLWGTMHSTHPAILDLPEQVRTDIAAARLVALEYDFRHATRREIARAVAYEGWTRQGSALWRFTPESTGIPERIITRIRDRTEAIGWQRTAPDYLTFGGLASLLLTDPCDDFSGGVLPIQDGRIQMIGLIAGARVIGLEPTSAFLDYLNDPSNRTVALSLIRIYGSYLRPEPGARETAFALYLRGQTGVLAEFDAAYLRAELGADADMHIRRMEDYLINTRNVGFVESALPELDAGGAFIAVGAAHLSGENGMVALLRKAGYTVTRTPLPGERPTL